MIYDSQNRTFKTLRISLNSSCNLACVYCVTPGKSHVSPLKQLSSTELYDLVEKLHKKLNFKTIRLTGGEPTLFPDLVNLVRKLSNLEVEIKMTTNAYLLGRLAKPLWDAGLKNVNISLDAVNDETFRKISQRSGLSKVLSSIEACENLGYQIKINAVVVKGINDNEILPLLKYAKSKNISLRFLELMKMGHLYSEDFDRYFFPESEILKEISSIYPFVQEKRGESATANYYKIDDGYKFGIIANESTPFCSDCDRLRLDIHGNIYGCLSTNKPIDILDAVHDDQSMEHKLREALAQKQSLKFTGSDLEMIAIGG